jgi:hypothetical protein
MVANVELKKKQDEQDERLTQLADSNKELQGQLSEALDIIKKMSSKMAEMEDAAVAAQTPDVNKNKKYIRPDRPETGGWVVKAPNDTYFGECYHTNFQGGVAIIYLEEDQSDFRASRLEADFGMIVQAAEDADILKALKYQAGVKPPEKTLPEKLLGG